MRLMGSYQRVVGAAVFALAALIALPATANVFSVEGVTVDATAENAADAREIAHSQGRRAAFETVLKRLTRPEDWPFLPAPGDLALAEMGAGLRIEEERNSRNRYLARIAYSFQPEAIRKALLDVRIPFSETQSAPLLVVPILEADGAVQLWEPGNPWLQAWADRSLGNELVPMISPLGDLTDISTVNAGEAMNADWLELRPLAERYGAGAVLVVVAVQEQAIRTGDPFTQPEQAGVTGSAGVRLELGMIRVERAGRSAYTAAVQGPLRADATTGGDTVFDRAVSEVIATIATDWKTRTLVDYSARYQMEATVRLASIQDWTDIRKRLTDIPTIVETDTLALSSIGAELRVVFAGTVEQLALGLDQQGLMLSGERGYWEIMRRGIVPAALEDSYGNRPNVFPLTVGGPDPRLDARGGARPPVPEGPRYQERSNARERYDRYREDGEDR